MKKSNQHSHLNQIQISPKIKYYWYFECLHVFLVTCDFKVTNIICVNRKSHAFLVLKSDLFRLLQAINKDEEEIVYHEEYMFVR